MSQNPWLYLKRVPGELAPPTRRPLADCLWRLVERAQPRRFRVVIGPRRVGKTTSMYQTVQSLLDRGHEPARLMWLRLDHPIFLEHTLDELAKFAIEYAQARGIKPTVARPLYLFLDELTYARDWDLWLKTFYDERWPVSIVATSSSAAALRDAGTKAVSVAGSRQASRLGRSTNT